jgi:hypothetical protein
MHMFRSARWLLLTLLLALIPASSHAQAVISVGFAPPELPVYEQPYCPEPNLMWSPGYWAYDQDQGDYYWVPGTWVPAPYEGALWTPDYWDWYGGRYRFHHGYWGRHVGYYGGVNYGGGYEGVGFSGGEWRGSEFRYNTAVTRVDQNRIHSTYNDRSIVERNTIVNNNRVAYSGGPGGVQHRPTATEQVAVHEQHTAPTSVQTQHVAAARTDKTSFAKANGGRPQNVVAAKPLGPQNHPAPAAVKTEAKPVPAAHPAPAPAPHPAPQPQAHPAPQPQARPAPQPQAHPAPQPQAHPAPQPQARPTPQPQSRPAPQPQARPAPQPQARPALQPQARPAPQPQAHPAPQPQARPAPQPQARPVPQQQARPAPQQQTRPAPQPQQHTAPAPKNEPKH